MKPLFKQEYCASCGKKYDPARGKCPNCASSYYDKNICRSWKSCTALGPGKEASVFLVGLIGLNIFVAIIELILIAYKRPLLIEQGLSGAELTTALNTYINSGEGMAIIFFPSYALLFVTLCLILWNDLGRVFKRFANPYTYLGIPLGFIMMAITIGYSYLVSMVPGYGDNQNQSNVNTVVQYSPYLSLLIFGFIGPFCEEITYRLGLFNFFKRFNTVIAYIVTAIVFGLIHFDFSNALSATEWLNLPIYMLMGAFLAFCYDKFGFGASYLAHATNNIFSVVSVMIASKAG
jgi:membrane protease YdiL (CAAX protease family)